MTYFELKSDCEIKAKNLQTAMNSVINNDFQSVFLLKNYVESKNESIKSIDKLVGYLESIS